MTELLPCPFCGSDFQRLYIDRMRVAKIECEGCGCRIQHDVAGCYDVTTAMWVKELFKEWNMREGSEGSE